MDWIELESFRLWCPLFTDALVWCEAFEGLQFAGQIVGGDEVREMGLLVTVRVKSFDGGLLDRTVHPPDPSIGPRVFHFRLAMFDAVLPAAHVEHVRHVLGGLPIGVVRLEGELDPVVSEDRVDPLG
jgi:hypothetical protein